MYSTALWDPGPGACALMDETPHCPGRTGLPDRCSRDVLLAGDAVSAIDRDRMVVEPQQLHRIAAVTRAFTVTSVARGLLRDGTLLPGEQICAIKDELGTTPLTGWKGRLGDRWACVVSDVHSAWGQLDARGKRSGAL